MARPKMIETPIIEEEVEITTPSFEELQAENARLQKLLEEHTLIVKEDVRLVPCPQGCETADKSKVTSWIRTNDRNMSRAKSAGWERAAKRDDLEDPEASFAYGAYVAGDKTYHNGQDLILMIAERSKIEDNERDRQLRTNAGIRGQNQKDEALGIVPESSHGHTQRGKFYKE